jgi:hypothetical protein
MQGNTGLFFQFQLLAAKEAEMLCIAIGPEGEVCVIVLSGPDVLKGR